MTPHHYRELGEEIGRLVETKQEAYGDSFGKSGYVMRCLYPDGINPGQMNDALAVVRVVDKLFRIATDRDALGETPWKDIAGYALLATTRVEAELRSPLRQMMADNSGRIRKSPTSRAERDWIDRIPQMREWFTESMIGKPPKKSKRSRRGANR